MSSLYKASKTKHKWANIWKYKSHYIIEENDGLYYEMTIPNTNSYMHIGKGYKDIDGCIEQAIVGKEEFLINHVIGL